MFRFKNILLVLVMLGLWLVPAAASVNAQNTQDFTINNFHSEYVLFKDKGGVGNMEITETITAQFPNFNQNHGILRALPLTYNDIELNIKVASVVNTTTGSTTYTSSKQNGNLVLKIGDANTYVRNQQTYVIKYSVKNVITDYSNYQELFWNVNGTQWQQPIENVSATILMPTDIASKFNNQLRCITGYANEKGQDCTITSQSNPLTGQVTISAVTTKSLNAGQNLSFVIGFQPGTFMIDKSAAVKAQLKKYAPFVLAVIAPISLFVLLFIRWLKKGRDSKGKGLIVPQYIPLRDLNVLEADTLLHETVTQKSVSAQLIELAIKKYLTIAEVNKEGTKVLGLSFGGSKDYELKLEKPIGNLSDAEQTVLKMVFGDYPTQGDIKLISSLKDKAYKQFGKMAKDVPKSLATRGFFTSNPTSAIGDYLKPGFILIAIIAVLVIVLLITGILQWPGGALAVIIPTSVAFIIANIIAAKIMPSKTVKGVEAKEYLLGLKEYIKLAEAERLKYLQSPEGAEKYGDPNTNRTKVKLFEKLLPYAIIFGLEKQWATSFEGIYSQPPNWYNGNWSSFNTGTLIGSLASFDGASAVSFSAPSSSGGSGFSGGSSGGGGGGGGGGGW